MPLRYEIVKDYREQVTINAYDDETGMMLSIPSDPANSDYQAYLDRDKPKAALSTPIVSGDE